MLDVDLAYRSYLYGKKVCVIGGSNNINWSLVNGADIAVWCNHHWLEQRGKCNVVYWGAIGDCKNFLVDSEFNPSFIFMHYAEQYPYREIVADTKEQREILNWCTKRNIKCGRFYPFALNECAKCPTEEWSSILHKSIKCRPMTGTIAITHLLQQPLQQLTTTAMDLFITKEKEILRRNGMHEPLFDGMYLHSLMVSDDRFKPGMDLWEALINCGDTNAI